MFTIYLRMILDNNLNVALAHIYFLLFLYSPSFSFHIKSEIIGNNVVYISPFLGMLQYIDQPFDTTGYVDTSESPA